MLVVEDPSELSSHVGRELGVSDWVVISQELITRFGEVTGDRNWIHTDPQRAARDMPGGTTIAHGYLTLSLGSGLMGQIYRVRRHGRVFNYGVDKLRFATPVPCGVRVRLRLKLAEVERRNDQGLKFRFAIAMELEHGAKPAARYEMLVLMYPQGL
jgi:acyl dehydratase